MYLRVFVYIYKNIKYDDMFFDKKKKKIKKKYDGKYDDKKNTYIKKGEILGYFYEKNIGFSDLLMK
jgi:hypothetical protein